MINLSKLFKLNPATLILGSFLITIFAGALILSLPIATGGKGISSIDSLFTSTSAVCVTGLVVVDTGTHFSMFGQCVILLLIQVGGLGVMTTSVGLFYWLGRGVSVKHRRLMQDLFSHTPRPDILRLVRSVFLFTMAIEGIGAILLTMYWWREYSLGKAFYLGLFHSISAFCNAGFSLFPDSLVRYSGKIFPNITICSLIVLGGIGFPVLYEIETIIKKRKLGRFRLSIHTRTVLLTTAILIIFGAVMFHFLEYSGSTTFQSPEQNRYLESLFQSITCRTAGFNTVDLAKLTEATQMLMIFLMFIGASPGSCGGGVKTTTIALLVIFIWSRSMDRRRVNVFRKSIPPETTGRSFALVVVATMLIGMTLFALLVFDPFKIETADNSKITFLEYLFETVSAFGTVGLSLGITGKLGTTGKMLIILLMYIGRVGILTFSYIVVRGGLPTGIEYSEENMMIG